MLRSLRSILQLGDFQNLRWLLEILIDIPIVWFLLIWMTLPNLLRWLDQPSKTRRPLSKKDSEQAALGWKYTHFLIVRCLKVKNPCLLRSLVLFHLLRRRGLDSQIHFGIKRETHPLEGHSWLSLNGNHPLEQVDPQRIYLPIYSYPYEEKIP
jgi:hypothetical protein